MGCDSDLSPSPMVIRCLFLIVKRKEDLLDFYGLIVKCDPYDGLQLSSLSVHCGNEIFRGISVGSTHRGHQDAYYQLFVMKIYLRIIIEKDEYSDPQQSTFASKITHPKTGTSQALWGDALRACILKDFLKKSHFFFKYCHVSAKKWRIQRGSKGECEHRKLLCSKGRFAQKSSAENASTAMGSAGARSTCTLQTQSSDKQQEPAAEMLHLCLCPAVCLKQEKESTEEEILEKLWKLSPNFPWRTQQHKAPSEAKLPSARKLQYQRNLLKAERKYLSTSGETRNARKKKGGCALKSLNATESQPSIVQSGEKVWEWVWAFWG